MSPRHTACENALARRGRSAPPAQHVVRAGGWTIGPGRCALAFVVVQLLSVGLLAGCAPVLPGWPAAWLDPTQPVVEASLPNPMFVQVADRELLWNQLVDELDDYFKIRQEQRVRLVGHVLTEGRIETFPTVGSSLLEPWRRDSATGFERVHATLQSIRRRAEARVIPTEGGYLVEVAVFKELEDLLQPQQATVTGAVLRHDTSPEREDPAQQPLPPGTLGWIALGRDVALEQQILANLQNRLALDAAPQRLPPAH